MTISFQLLSLLAMIGSGVIVGACIDLLRVTKEHTSPRSFFKKYYVFLEIIIWILLGIGTFYLLFQLRDGAWRIIDPIAQLLGIICYELFFQPIFRVVGRILFLILIRPIWFILHLFVSIIRQVVRLLVRIIVLFFTPFWKFSRKIWRLVLKK